jgi:[acyl-carrier-protein] S-malonyltransferase
MREHVLHAPLRDSSIDLVMNVTGDFVKDLQEIKQNMIKQITSPVRWEQGIRAMARQGVNLFIEIGCGKTLVGMNKRIGIPAETISIEKIADIDALENYFKEKATR